MFKNYILYLGGGGGGGGKQSEVIINHPLADDVLHNLVLLEGRCNVRFLWREWKWISNYA